MHDRSVVVLLQCGIPHHARMKWRTEAVAEAVADFEVNAVKVNSMPVGTVVHWAFHCSPFGAPSLIWITAVPLGLIVMCRVWPVHSPTYREFFAGAAVLVGVTVLVDAAVVVDVDDAVVGAGAGESFEHAVTPAINPSATTPVAAQRILLIVLVPFRSGC